MERDFYSSLGGVFKLLVNLYFLAFFIADLTLLINQGTITFKCETIINNSSICITKRIILILISSKGMIYKNFSAAKNVIYSPQRSAMFCFLTFIVF